MDRYAETFDRLANEDWRIMVDEYDINEPMICYPDPDRRGAYVGPLVRVQVGATVENEDGDECLELNGADGRNLYAVACLPHLAALCSWIDRNYASLGVSENDEFNKFADELKARVDWIRALIDDRDMELAATGGAVGFPRYGNE